jgi:mycothiol synthase
MDFVDAVQGGGPEGREQRRQTFRENIEQPGLAPTENCLILEQSDQIQGYCLIHWEPLIGRAVLGPDIAPDVAGTPLERELVRRAVARAETLQAEVAHLCLAQGSNRQQLLEEEGFSLVRDYWDMLWDHTPLPEVKPPEGFNIRPFQSGDSPALTQVQNDAFTGSWGFSPNTVDQIDYRVGLSNTSHQGIQLLLEEDRTAGYCWTIIVPANGQTKGIIGMIGIAPEYRGRGISKPILIAGMRYLLSAGVAEIGLHVDGSNSPAIRLYQSVGFDRIGGLNWFEYNLKHQQKPG